MVIHVVLSLKCILMISSILSHGDGDCLCSLCSIFVRVTYVQVNLPKERLQGEYFN